MRAAPSVEAWRTLKRARLLLSEREQMDAARLRYGRLAGVLFILGGVAYRLSALELADSNHLAVYIVTAVAISCGVICGALPWERLPNASLHVVVVVADVVVVGAVWATDPVTGAFFILVGVFAAYAVQTRRQILAHVVLIGLLCFVPLLYEPSAQASVVRSALLYLPITALAAGVITYLCERAEVQEQRLRSFAAEAIDIAESLLGDREVADDDADQDGEVSSTQTPSGEFRGRAGGPRVLIQFFNLISKMGVDRGPRFAARQPHKEAPDRPSQQAHG